MSKHFFLSPRFQQLSKLSTWLFLLATILLHILLLESAAWKDWSPKPTLENLPNISVSLHPTTQEQAPVADEPIVAPKKVAKPSKPQATKAASAPQPESRVEEVATVAAEPSPTVSNEVTAELPIETHADAGAESSTALPEFSFRAPESAEMQLEITHTKVNGSPTTGVGKLIWERANGQYKLSIEAGINLLITNLNLLTITSEGHIDLFGLSPVVSNDIRRTRPATAIHFKQTEKTIHFSASNKVIPMENGAQDAVSILIQLAAIGYSDPSQLHEGKEFTIQVAEGRDATPFTFRVLGEEELDSPLAPETGKLRTVHVIRPPKPGLYNSQLDIWLAPSLGWYPIQIRNTESNGTITNQAVIALKQKINREN